MKVFQLNVMEVLPLGPGSGRVVSGDVNVNVKKTYKAYRSEAASASMRVNCISIFGQTYFIDVKDFQNFSLHLYIIKG